MASLVLLVSELLRLQNPGSASVETLLYSCSIPPYVATQRQNILRRNEANGDVVDQVKIEEDVKESKICVDMVWP
ncbi:hypothetical protein OWV82_022443 [Melia azedarach]|uniref:Uncharacterized protein n=1 Tax=Melia azedarach TaxID=155640 RepID=A0ACC1X2L1_MELAZ|nr:hypothetical protein OWV82_022443 [Melia azedarach]